MIEDLKFEDYHTRMIEEQLQSLYIKKNDTGDEIKRFEKLLESKKPNALNRMMDKRKREEYVMGDAQTLKEELKDQLIEAEKKKIRIILSEEQKKRVLEITEIFGPTKAEELTGVSDKNIFRWKTLGKENLKRKPGSGRRVRYPQFEAKLLNYFKEIRKTKFGLSTRKFIIYARSEAKKDSNIKIKFSRGWLHKFMTRNKITLRKRSTTAQNPIEQTNDLVEKFRKKLHDLIYHPESIYDKDHVVNVDETAIKRDSPPDRTMENKGEKKVVIASGGKEKEKITTVVAMSLTGKRLGQMLILKGKGVKKPKCTVPNDVIITYNEKSSWMTSTIMLQWVNFILFPYAKKLPPGKFGLLIMDSHSTHLDDKVVKKIQSFRYHIIYLPPNTTGRTQPIDIGINKLLKNHYQNTWEVWFEDILKNFPKTGHYISPSKELMIGWVWKSLRKITPEQIINSWSIYTSLDVQLPQNGKKLLFSKDLIIIA